MSDLNRLKLVLVEKKKTSKWLSEQLNVNPSTVSKDDSSQITSFKVYFTLYQQLIGKARCFSVQELIDSDCNFDLCKFPKDEEEVLPPAELLADYFKKRKALDHEINKTLAEIQKILGIEINVEE